MKYYYYLITNLQNGKKYAGITINPDQRKHKHFQELRNNYHHSSKLQNAYNKYGADCFKFEVIETKDFDFKTDAYLYEIDFIKKNNSYLDGYNMEPGGIMSAMLNPEVVQKVKESNQNRVPNIYQIDINSYQIINVFNSLHEAERETGIFRSNITKVCNRTDISSGGYYWCYDKDWSENWIPPLNQKYKPIALIDKNNGKIIKVFPSCAEAGRQLKLDRSNIRSSINRNGSCGGYKFRYISLEEYESYTCRD